MREKISKIILKHLSHLNTINDSNLLDVAYETPELSDRELLDIKEIRNLLLLAGWPFNESKGVWSNPSSLKQANHMKIVGAFRPARKPHHIGDDPNTGTDNTA